MLDRSQRNPFSSILENIIYGLQSGGFFQRLCLYRLCTYQQLATFIYQLTSGAPRQTARPVVGNQSQEATAGTATGQEHRHFPPRQPLEGLISAPGGTRVADETIPLLGKGFPERVTAKAHHFSYVRDIVPFSAPPGSTPIEVTETI